MPKVRRGVVDNKKQATVDIAKMDFAQMIQATQDAKGVAELRVAVGDLASGVKVLAMAAGLWEEKRA